VFRGAQLVANQVPGLLGVFRERVAERWKRLENQITQKTLTEGVATALLIR
jgi:hypothetical protein